MNDTTITCARCEREGIVWADADGREHLCSAHAADEIMGMRAAAHQDAQTVTRLYGELREMHDMRDQALDEAREGEKAWREALRVVKADRDRLLEERDAQEEALRFLRVDRDAAYDELSAARIAAERDEAIPSDSECVL